jgi:hypothetical protein
MAENLERTRERHAIQRKALERDRAKELKQKGLQEEEEEDDLSLIRRHRQKKLDKQIQAKLQSYKDTITELVDVGNSPKTQCTCTAMSPAFMIEFGVPERNCKVRDSTATALRSFPGTELRSHSCTRDFTRGQVN